MGKELTACSPNDIKITIAQPGFEKWFALVADLRKMVDYERKLYNYPIDYATLQNIDWRDSFLANVERTLRAGYAPTENQIDILNTLAPLGKQLP